MRQLLLLVILVLFTWGSDAQVLSRSQDRPLNSNNRQNRGNPTSRKIEDFNRPPVRDYKIVSIQRDTTYVDTSLTMAKDYQFNYLRKDRYGLLPFANTGQTHNRLIKDYNSGTSLPLFGAQARHFNYMDVNDIYYYEVPTPLTELYYRSAFEQGQQLDAFFTMNLSPRFNFSIAYKGVRSLGKYQNALTSSGNYRFTFNYRTENERYEVLAHWVAQDLFNQENGGLSDLALEQFRSGFGEFDDRARLTVNFEDAGNTLDGQRFYVNHSYKLVQPKDSVTTNTLSLGHVMQFEDQFYRFEQTSPSALFGPSLQTNNLKDRVDLETLQNTLSLSWSNPLLGQLGLFSTLVNFEYGYNSVFISDADGDGTDERVPSGISDYTLLVGANYKKQYKGFAFEAEAETAVAGLYDSNRLQAQAKIQLDSLNALDARASWTSRPANYNHLLYQSDYINYNWYHLNEYDNVQTVNLEFKAELPKWVNADLRWRTILNHAYFAEVGTDSLVQSQQFNGTVNYLSLTVHKDLKWGKFGLDTRLTYQNVAEGEGVFNVPEFLGRGTLYFTDRWFKDALFVQTGFTASYFSTYSMDAYDPVLAEFYTQNEQKLGAFPLLDFFFNMKVRQTRIFIKAEHFNSPFTGNDFFSAPGYPYRDFNLRFGIVWNFFL
ncbi:putative porin [Croceiramulus getboli]|nr:putative porin [Flavobacteriaceae bacterium YJPT1-3]